MSSIKHLTMQTAATSRADRKFTIGVSLMVLGYAIINITVYFAVFGLPFYLVGMILVLFSAKSWKTKLLVTIPPLLINYFTVIALVLQFDA
jgi:hypothetical protein